MRSRILLVCVLVALGALLVQPAEAEQGDQCLLSPAADLNAPTFMGMEELRQTKLDQTPRAGGELLNLLQDEDCEEDSQCSSCQNRSTCCICFCECDLLCALICALQ